MDGQMIVPILRTQDDVGELNTDLFQKRKKPEKRERNRKLTTVIATER